MMMKQGLTMMWDHLRQANGIALRLVASLPADKLDARPVAKMRTPKELLVHLYGSSMLSLAEGALSGEVREYDEKAALAKIKTRDDLVRYCTDCWKASDRAIAAVTDANLGAQVKTPWGSSMPGFVCASAINDEFFHHRGQLYTYLRAFGQEVPEMWDFEHNAPEYRPKVPATA